MSDRQNVKKNMKKNKCSKLLLILIITAYTFLFQNYTL